MNFQNGPLEQRLEKKMNVQLSITPPAADQRIILPVSSTAFTSGASEPQALFLSLVIAGQTTRRIFGGVGLYHPNQSKPELLNIVQGPNFSPVVAIASGRTVCIGFKFATYPRQWDPSEDAFRCAGLPILWLHVFNNIVESSLRFMTVMESLSHITCPRLHTPSNLTRAKANDHSEHQPTIPRVWEIQGRNDVGLILHSLLHPLPPWQVLTHSPRVPPQQVARVSDNPAALRILVATL